MYSSVLMIFTLLFNLEHFHLAKLKLYNWTVPFPSPWQLPFYFLLRWLWRLQIHQWNRTALVLTYLTQHSILKVYPCCRMWQDFLFHSWVIFLCVCVCLCVYFLYPFICPWIFELPLPLGYCELCCNECECANNSLISYFQFFGIYTQKWHCWIKW